MKPKSKHIKVACRRLPPKLANQQFAEQFQKWVKKSIFTYFASGDHKYCLNYHHIHRDPQKRTFSTAYLTFTTEQDYKEFFAEVNGHTFLDEKGINIYLTNTGGVFKMQIELAIHQKIPGKKQKIPETAGTFAQCEEYVKFVERTTKEVEKALSADLLEEEKAVPHIAPLVQELNEVVGGERRAPKRQRRYQKKEEVKYAIRKRPVETREEEPQFAEPKAKIYYGKYGGGKNGGVIYRKKQPAAKEEEK